MAEAGADLIELGIPFSDPIAEGPVIQEADNRALSGGVTTDDVFEMMYRVRRNCDIPVAFMTYVNPIFTYGSEKFMMKCHEAGIDAIIVPDLPFEEKGELLPFCRKYGVTLFQ
jgi:tryptophan synthase alpha chain